MYLAARPGLAGVKPTQVHDGLVSDIVAGDWLVGSRQLVVSTGATTSNLRALTLRRSNAADVTVNWLATSAVRIAK